MVYDHQCSVDIEPWAEGVMGGFETRDVVNCCEVVEGQTAVNTSSAKILYLLNYCSLLFREQTFSKGQIFPVVWHKKIWGEAVVIFIFQIWFGDNLLINRLEGTRSRREYGTISFKLDLLRPYVSKTVGVSKNQAFRILLRFKIYRMS